MADVYGWQEYLYAINKRRYSGHDELKSNWDQANSQIQSMSVTFTNNSKQGISQAPARIQTAIQFLDSAIAIERSKEANFLIMLQEGPIAKIFGKERKEKIDVYAKQGNWKQFMREFQSIIGEQRTKKDVIQTKAQTLNNGVKTLKQYQQSNNELLTPTKLNNFLKKSIKPGDLTRILNDAIIKAIQNKQILDLRDIKNANDMLKKVQTIALSALIAWAQEKKELVASDFTADVLSKYMKNTASIEDLTKTLSQIDQEIEDLKNTIPILREQKSQGKWLSKEEWNLLKNGEKQLQRLEDTRKALNKIDLDSEITKAIGLLELRLNTENQYGIAELEDAVAAIAADTCAAAIQLGAEGAKPDVLVGHIQITTSDTAEQAATNIYEQYNTTMANFLSQYKEGMRKDNTYEYYITRANTIRNALNNAKELNNENDISNWFVIEESTKSYDKVQAGESSSFTGGSLGPNLADQLTKISTIITALDKAGSEKIDETMNEFGWLLANTINKELIASPIKDRLLLYLSTFVTIFLFDDQVLIWQDALKNTFNTEKFPTENHRLHLFSLNQDYYPLSFILQAVRERIAREFGEKDINKQFADAGAKVLFDGIPSLNLPEDFYRPIASQIIEDLKLKVEFLNNFQGLIQALYNN